MTTLYTIIKSLQSVQGSNAKTALLEQHKDNELLKEFMRITYDPSINFYQTKVPKSADWDTTGTHGMNIEWLAMLVDNLANRKVTGAQAKTYLGWYNHVMNTEHRELLKLIIDRSIGAGVGDTMVLKTWPKLFFSVPYQRCSLLDAKAKAKFSKLATFACEEKADGSFCYLVKEAGKTPQAITRAGSCYPSEFAEKIAEGIPDGYVLMGELLVFTSPQYDGKMDVLNRQTANGMLNSILKGGVVDTNFVYKMFAWDVVTVEEFRKGRSTTIHKERLVNLKEITTKSSIPYVEHIETTWVSSLEEAYKIYSSYTSQGIEGAVIKTEDFLWSNGTSKDCVKMKVEFEIDLEIYAVNEGTGKATGMMGSVSVKSREGILKSDVGTGFSDRQRKEVWDNPESYLGTIMAVKANDIISNRKDDSKSLFLPVHLEIRLDKTFADTYDECIAQLNAAKGITKINSHK